MWIPEENENCQGQKNCEPQKASGTQELVCLRPASFKFPRSSRLRKRFEYQRLSKFGRRLHGKVVSFDYRVEGALSPRLGITVSKKYGNACKRNYFKRLVRETFRELSSLLPQGLCVNVHPRQPQVAISKSILLSDFKLILHAEPRTKKSS